MAFLFRDSIVSGKPTFTTIIIRNVAGIGERGKGRNEDGTFGRFEDSGVTIINGTIENSAWKGPGFSVVIGPLKFNPAKGANMLLPPAGAYDKELAIGSSGQGRPAMIEIRQETDRFNSKNDRGGLGTQLQVKSKRPGKSEGDLLKKVPSRRSHLESMSD